MLLIDFIQPICLPFEDFSRPEIGDRVYTSGWGKTYERGTFCFSDNLVLLVNKCY